MAEKIQAVNHYVFVERDATESEKSGLVIPSAGKVKPHSGTIISAGNLVKDSRIKNGKGKRCLWHPTVGQEIEYKDQKFLILEDIHVIGVM